MSDFAAGGEGVGEFQCARGLQETVGIVEVELELGGAEAGEEGQDGEEEGGGPLVDGASGCNAGIAGERVMPAIRKGV